MTGHDLSAGGDVMDRVRGCAQDALAAYGGHPGTLLIPGGTTPPNPPGPTIELLNVSENATFLVSDPDTGPSVLRVHRLGYHTEQEIASELAWMDALRAEAGVRTPRVLPAADGRRVVTVPEAGGAAERYCVRFEFLPGTEPGAGPADDPGRAGTHFAELGELTAPMHRHAREWRPPAWFTRFHWDYPAAFGDQARWGRWQDGIGVGPAEHEILTRLDTSASTYETSPGSATAAAAACRSSAAPRAASASRPVISTFAPFRAKTLAIPLPIPRVPPVTTTARPAIDVNMAAPFQ